MIYSYEHAQYYTNSRISRMGKISHFSKKFLCFLMMKIKMYTWDSRWHWPRRTVSCWLLSLAYSSSSFLFFHRARRFWNQTATCLGSRPNSLAIFSFLPDSSLCSFSKLYSSIFICSSVNFLFLNIAPIVATSSSLVADDPLLLLFLLRFTGFDPSPDDAPSIWLTMMHWLWVGVV